MKFPIYDVVRFLTDRNLHEMPFDEREFNTNVVEELFEVNGYEVPKELRPKLREEFRDFMGWFVSAYELPKRKDHGIDDIIDGITDIRVFCIDATVKLKYDPECTLYEVAKEINSREGEIIDGKFQKYTTPEAKAKWYKADFSGCKRVYHWRACK